MRRAACGICITAIFLAAMYFGWTVTAIFFGFLCFIFFLDELGAE